MGLRETNQIDLMAVEKETGYINLFIVDAEDWEDEDEHILLLQEKINTYLSFIESGEVYETYPEAEGKQFVIKVHAKYRCTEWGEKFLEKANEILENAGFGFRYEWKPSEEDVTVEDVNVTVEDVNIEKAE